MFGKKRLISANFEKPNFAWLVLERCDQLLQEANESSVNGDLERWRRVLGAILRTIYFLEKRGEEQKTTLKEIKEAIVGVRKDYQNISTTKSNLFQYNMEKKLEDIEVKLVILMYENSLYYPNKQKKSWEDNAEDEDL